MLIYFSTVIVLLTLLYSVLHFAVLCLYHARCGDFLFSRCIFAVTISLLVAGWGMRKKSLDLTGALGGIIVGLVLTFSSYCFLACLLTFFYTSSKATHFHSKKKRKFEDNYREGGQRNWIQVVCNGGTATQLSLIYLLSGGVGEAPLEFEKDFFRSWLSAAVLAALAGANGDTWASEIGTVLSENKPRLITTLREVPTGTNGGVSCVGIIVSALGGAAVGVAYFLCLFFTTDISNELVYRQAVLLIFTGAFAGLFGSIFDSLLGATLQYSGIDSYSGKIVEKPGPGVKHISGISVLDNHSVNMIMSIASSVVVPSVTAKLYPILCYIM